MRHKVFNTKLNINIFYTLNQIDQIRSCVFCKSIVFAVYISYILYIYTHVFSAIIFYINKPAFKSFLVVCGILVIVRLSTITPSGPCPKNLHIVCARYISC